MKKKKLVFDVINSHAAGIDVGSREHYVAVGQQADQVRRFGVYTQDHEALILYMREHSINTVAMESTGTYWQTLFSAIQSAGIQVLLTNSKQIKNPSGKTDVKDARWLQKLHTLGLLNGNFLPTEQVKKLRSYHRHRTMLSEDGTRYILRMQKAMQQMNVRLEIALSDISGQSGMRIIHAILQGERDGKILAKLAHGGVKKSKEEIAAALVGNWKDEHLYELRDAYELYLEFTRRVENCDYQINRVLMSMASEQMHELPQDVKLSVKKRQGKQVKVNVSAYSYQYFGTDLLSIDGVAHNTVMTLLAEVGNDIYKFSTARKFCRWLRLAPDNRISGSKVISSRTPSGRNVLANALRNAANTVGQRKDGSMKKFFSRIAYKKGRAAAITATARKLAVIIWNMIVKKQPYKLQNEVDYENRIRNQVIGNLKRKMKQLDIHLGELADNEFLTS